MSNNGEMDKENVVYVHSGAFLILKGDEAMLVAGKQIHWRKIVIGDLSQSNKTNSVCSLLSVVPIFGTDTQNHVCMGHKVETELSGKPQRTYWGV